MNLTRSAGLAVTLVVLLVPCPAARAQKPPEEELQTLRTPDGMEVSLYASEPMITNPSAIDVDTQGRVWVAEIEWYRSQAKTPPADKIKVLEDTDGDGKADRATVFADGVFAPMSICVAGDKVYVATSPDLWVYEDKNGDLVADGPPKKLLTGFGGHNHDHGAHSLVLGPDHKWWMSHGDGGFDVRGTDGSHIEHQWGAMLRGELDGGKLETVAVNFRNPYEICVSSFGEAYCSDNDNDGNESVRICWILQGGDYGWFGRPPFAKEELDVKAPLGTPYREAWHFRGYMPGYVPGTLVTGFGSPCGICFYEGDAFGDHYKNAPWHADAGPREVRMHRHRLAGGGMAAASEVIVSNQGDDYFRPDDVCAAPDGAVYVSDWYDGGVGGHAYNDPKRGRIFLLRPAGKTLARVGKPGPYENVAVAIEGLKNPNLATQYLARERLLADGEESVPVLVALLDDPEKNYAARALWVLDRIGGAGRDVVVDQLANDDASFRALAARILRRHGDQYAGRLFPLAADASAEVRREVLLALPEIPGPAALDVLVTLAATYDGADRYLLETINIAAAGRKPELLAALAERKLLTVDRIELLQILDRDAASELLAERLTAGDATDAERRQAVERLGLDPSNAAADAVLKLTADDQTSDVVRRAAFGVLNSNLSHAWRSLASSERLDRVLGAGLADPKWQASALTIIGDQSLGRFGDEVLTLIESAGTAPEVRRQAVATAVSLRHPRAGEVLEGMLASGAADWKQMALDGLIDLGDAAALRQAMTSQHVSGELRAAAVGRLMSTTGGALVLLRLIDQDQLDADVRDAAVARAASHPDSNVRVLFEKFIPEGRRSPRLGEAVEADAILALEGNGKRGETIFFQSSAAQCKNCHAVLGTGGALGPDLSQIGKKYDRAALLETILQPSKAIAPEYIAYLLETDAGRIHAGFVVEKNDREVVLKDAESRLVRVPAEEVVVLEPRKESLMPELVLRDVSAQDAADLLAYLSGLTEGVQVVERFRILGPFAANARRLDAVHPVENDLKNPDLSEGHQGVDDAKLRWEPISADASLGFAAVDLAAYCGRRSLRSDRVVNYLLAYADSGVEQTARLLVGSGDGCQVWLNGREVFRHDGARAVVYAQDQVDVQLNQGRNVIVVKVVNREGDSGLSLAISSGSFLQLRTE